MRRASRGTGLVVLGLAVVVAAGCASDKKMIKSGSGDIVADRQRLMRLNGASWADIQAKMKAGNIDAIVVNAETIALSAGHIPALFPEGTDRTTPTRSRKSGRTSRSCRSCRRTSRRAPSASGTPPRPRIRPRSRPRNLKEFGPKACGACHTPFRVPPPRTS